MGEKSENQCSVPKDPGIQREFCSNARFEAILVILLKGPEIRLEIRSMTVTSDQGQFGECLALSAVYKRSRANC